MSDMPPSTPNPAPVPSNPTPPKKKSFKDLLEESTTWIALVLIVSAVVSTAGALQFIESKVRSEVQSPEIKKLLAAAVPVTALPKGALVIYAGPCPLAFEDLTETMDGRYLFVDLAAKTNVIPHEGDGSHNHVAGGEHTHPVSGRAGPLGGGERSGTQPQTHAAHKDNFAPVTGMAAKEGAAHDHGGGAHQHRRLGVRLCKM